LRSSFKREGADAGERGFLADIILMRGHIVGVFGFLFFLVFAFIAMAVYPGGYSFFGQVFSELGVAYPSSLFFNSAVIVTGLCMFPFFYRVSHEISAEWLAGYGRKVFLASGFISALGLIGVGVFPMNVRPYHFYAALLFFFFAALSTFLFGLNTLRDREQWNMADFFVSMSVSVMVFLLVVVMMPRFDSYEPVVQKMAVFSVGLWAVYMALKAERQGRREKGRKE